MKLKQAMHILSTVRSFGKIEQVMDTSSSATKGQIMNTEKLLYLYL